MANDLVKKATVKILVIRRPEENRIVTPLAEYTSNKRVIYGSQTAVETIPIFTNPEIEEVEKKRKYRFSMDFPQYQPIQFDTTLKKVLINGKPMVPQKDKPLRKEKIIMN